MLLSLLYSFVTLIVEILIAQPQHAHSHRRLHWTPCPLRLAVIQQTRAQSPEQPGPHAVSRSSNPPPSDPNSPPSNRPTTRCLQDYSKLGSERSGYVTGREEALGFLRKQLH